jgi:hypothetical protein
MNKPQKTIKEKKIFLRSTRILKRMLKEAFRSSMDVENSIRLDFPKLVNEEFD